MSQVNIDTLEGGTGEIKMNGSIQWNTKALALTRVDSPATGTNIVQIAMTNAYQTISTGGGGTTVEVKFDADQLDFRITSTGLTDIEASIQVGTLEM